MLRLLALVLLALAPLLASAHGSHQHASPSAEVAKAPAIELGAVGIAAAPSHCPTGSGSVCCCHGFSCTTPFHAVAVATASVARVLPSVGATVSYSEVAPRPTAHIRFSPRGPPLFS